MIVRRVPEDPKGNGIQGGCRDGVLDTPFGKFARLQILTIEDLFAGKKPAMPPEDPAAFRRAAREEDKTRQAKLI